MRFVVTHDDEAFTYEVESIPINNGFSFNDPIDKGTFYVYHKNDEVLVRREGKTSMQETYNINHKTAGYYKHEGLLFKTIVETTLLIKDEEKILIEYIQTIGHQISNKTMIFWLK